MEKGIAVILCLICLLSGCGGQRLTAEEPKNNAVAEEMAEAVLTATAGLPVHTYCGDFSVAYGESFWQPLKIRCIQPAKHFCCVWRK